MHLSSNVPRRHCLKKMTKLLFLQITVYVGYNVHVHT